MIGRVRHYSFDGKVTAELGAHIFTCVRTLKCMACRHTQDGDVETFAVPPGTFRYQLR